MGLGAHEGAPGLGRGNGDLREGVGIGVLVEANVGEDEGAVVTILAVGHTHDHEAGYQLGPGGGLQDLQCGAQSVGGGVACAGDQAVGIAHLDHHGAKVGAVVHQLASLLDGHALLGAQAPELLGIDLVLGRGAGIDDGGTRHVNGHAGVVKNDQVGQILVDDLRGCLQGARIFALRKHDGLLVGGRLGLHRAQKVLHSNSLSTCEMLFYRQGPLFRGRAYIVASRCLWRPL